MAKYKGAAAREVDSSIGAAKKVNNAAIKQAISEYAQYLSVLQDGQGQAEGSMRAAQGDDRARMANILAARGGAGDGSAQFNYGRLNAQHEGAMAGLLGNFMNKRAELLQGQAKTVGGINAQNQALDISREGKIAELARALEDRAFAQQMQQRQIALQETAAREAHQQRLDAAKALKAQKDEADRQDEMAFKENLRLLLKDGASTPELAAYARQYGRSLSDYYDYLPQPWVDGVRQRRLASNLLSNPAFPSVLSQSDINAVLGGSYVSPYAAQYAIAGTDSVGRSARNIAKPSPYAGYRFH